MFINQSLCPKNISDWHNSWKVVDAGIRSGDVIQSGVPHKLITTVATFSADISYNEIYPACDIAVYEKTLSGATETFTLIQKEPQSKVKVVNGKFSLVLNLKE